MDFYIGGKLITPGMKVKSFRGETWKFLSITREPEPGKSGKVLAQKGKMWEQELYPSVFNGEIR